MKNLLKLEELLLLGLSIYLFMGLDYAWWWYALLFFAPDLSMIGYLWNPGLGSWTYNLVHHTVRAAKHGGTPVRDGKGTAAALYILGFLLKIPTLQFAGTLLLGHSSFDRVFGYGLKYSDSFHNTHLGIIGKSN
jgi:hypothetical protein